MAEAAPKYDREQIYGENREKTKQDIYNNKEKIKYNLNNDEGKTKLSEAWMKRANLSEPQKDNIFQKLGLKEKPDLTTKEGQKVFTEAVKKWQSDPAQANNRGTIGKADGVLWWATLEALDSDDKLKDIKEKESSKIAANKTTSPDIWKLPQELAAQKEKKLPEQKTPDIQKKQEQLKKLQEDIKSQDRAVTDDLKDADGNRLQMVDNDGVRSVEWTGDKSGKNYNVDTGAYEDKKTPQEIAQNTLWNLFIRWTLPPNGPDWKQDYLSNKGTNGKTHWDQLLWDIDNVMKNTNWSSQEWARQILTQIQTQYKNLSSQDQAILTEKKITLSQYRDMAKDPLLAAKIAPTDKPGKLPAWLGQKWMLYQQDNSGAILKMDEKGGPIALIKDWKETNITQYAIDSKEPSHDLPNGARITRITEWNKQVLKYFANKSDESAKYTYAWGKWESVKKSA